MGRDFPRGVLDIPFPFWSVTYDGACYPGAPDVMACNSRANCQQFAYELLRHNGFAIANLRSSDLWADSQDTAPVIGDLQPGDLLLFNRRGDAWGAHVAVYLRGGRAIHLAKHIGKPAIWTLAQFAACPRYASFIGAKRPIRRKNFAPVQTEAAMPSSAAWPASGAAGAGGFAGCRRELFAHAFGEALQIS